MHRYTLLCTEEQTRKALELGAPITELPFSLEIQQDTLDKYHMTRVNGAYYEIPTAEQMIGWLRSKNILFRFDDEEDYWSICDANDVTNDDSTPLRWYSWIENKELKAIDAALEYLETHKQ